MSEETSKEASPAAPEELTAGFFEDTDSFLKALAPAFFAAAALGKQQGAAKATRKSPERKILPSKPLKQKP